MIRARKGHHDHRHLLKGISHGACVAHELTKLVVRPAKLVVIVSSIRQRGSSCFLVSTPPTQAARVKRHHEQQLRTELTARVARHQACTFPAIS